MSTEQNESKTVSYRMLYEKLLIAFREAKENGLRWHYCEAAAEEAIAEVFPDPEIEAERKAALLETYTPNRVKPINIIREVLGKHTAIPKELAEVGRALARTGLWTFVRGLPRQGSRPDL